MIGLWPLWIYIAGIVVVEYPAYLKLMADIGFGYLVIKASRRLWHADAESQARKIRDG